MVILVTLSGRCISHYLFYITFIFELLVLLNISVIFYGFKVFALINLVDITSIITTNFLHSVFRGPPLPYVRDRIYWASDVTWSGNFEQLYCDPYKMEDSNANAKRKRTLDIVVDAPNNLDLDTYISNYKG